MSKKSSKLQYKIGQDFLETIVILFIKISVGWKIIKKTIPVRLTLQTSSAGVKERINEVGYINNPSIVADTTSSIVCCST